MLITPDRITVGVLDRRHLGILAGGIEDTPIVRHIPVAHVLVQPIQPMPR